MHFFKASKRIVQA